MIAKSNYRPDIDGLRAIAVGLVVLTHAGVPGFGGGFVGVDIFFVISGYLITSILLREAHEGSYSLARFYERRIRRIFPALVAVLVATTAAGLYILTPDQLAAYGKSMLATILFVSNFYLGMTANYFDPDAETLPLLHTWSLAVEEQFYIFFPIILVALVRWYPRGVRAAVWIMAGLSFAACVALTELRPTMAFYLAPTRAWELLAGALLAIHAPRGGAVAGREWLAQALGLVGLALILAAGLGFTTQTPFPGWAAALPVLGSAALIMAGGLGGGIVTRLLSSAPMRGLGLISYSLYLWHWPVIVLLRFWTIDPPTPLQMGLAMLATLGLSILSWKYVEQPFRHAGRKPGRLRYPVLWAGAGSILAVCALSAVLVQGKGLPGRFSPQERLLLVEEPKDGSVPCDEQTDWREIANCRIGAPDAPESFLLWGDSHGRSLLPGFDAAMKLLDRGGLYVGIPGCAPLLEMSRANEPFPSLCFPLGNHVLSVLDEHPDIRTVYLVSRWSIYAQGKRFKHSPTARQTLIVDAESSGASLAENPRVFARALDRTIAELRRRGLKVVVLNQVPDIGYHVSIATVMAGRLQRDIDLRTSRAEYDDFYRSTAAILAPHAKRDEITLVPLEDLLCDQTMCRITTQEGLPAYWDDNHLSRRGARELAPGLADLLRD
ncbi:acyltransferase family protein [Paracoccus lutimaris]|uniref:Peptidoglycan/LPS O-acetylase OafA/YrhL n=1 Tax=Paracoccus lutimaris TaxID=1490030 RepID=A0A368YNF2_9RHOB|nr:acyltransferase family protein [Paracoccus lutimaris]RCW81068.1 peptidoglycan/LPS O-acetylase OafA/YrhL [Paracoccus lutimaris]